MKKKYVEPEIFFESFELNANVAGVCEISVGFSESDCSLSGPVGTIFNSIPSPCDYEPQDNGTICYHNPSSPFSS